MSDRRDDPHLRRSLAAEPEPEPSLAELVDSAVRKIVTAIVIAGALIGAGAYASGDETEAPTYQVTSTADGRIIRLNTDSGTVIACRDDRCGIVLRRGQDIAEEIGEAVRERVREETRERALPAPAPEARPAGAPAAPQADNAAVPATR